MESVEKIIKKYIDVDYDLGDRVKVKDVNILKDVNKNEWEWGHFNEKDMEAIKNANEKQLLALDLENMKTLSMWQR